MRILVTGATGLLGSDLCRQLGEAHEVIGWARRVGQGQRMGRAVLAPVDLTDQETVKAQLNRFQPQVVFHTAAMTDVDACESDPQAAWALNRDAVETLARGCNALGTFLVAFSTDYVFEGAAGRPYREEDPPNPVNLYGRTKWEGERKALEIASRSLVIRVSGLFGSARPNFGWTTVKLLCAGKPVPAVEDQMNSPSYTVDLALALSKILELFEGHPDGALPNGPLHGILHLANQGGATRLEVARELARLLGVSDKLIQPTTWQALSRPAPRPPDSRLDCTRFLKLTGIALKPWPEALKEFVRACSVGSSPGPLDLKKIT